MATVRGPLERREGFLWWCAVLSWGYLLGTVFWPCWACRCWAIDQGSCFAVPHTQLLPHLIWVMLALPSHCSAKGFPHTWLSLCQQSQ